MMPRPDRFAVGFERFGLGRLRQAALHPQQLVSRLDSHPRQGQLVIQPADVLHRGIEAEDGHEEIHQVAHGRAAVLAEHQIEWLRTQGAAATGSGSGFGSNASGSNYDALGVPGAGIFNLWWNETLVTGAVSYGEIWVTVQWNDDGVNHQLVMSSDSDTASAGPGMRAFDDVHARPVVLDEIQVGGGEA